MKSVILLPSYNRAELLNRFLKFYKETETSTPCWVLVDKNDPQKELYLALTYPKDVALMFTEERSMGGKVRSVWDQVKDLDAVCLLNDDHILKTPQWDQKCLSQITGSNIIGTNDGWVAPQRLAGATWWSGKVLRTIGYIFPEGIDHLFIDTVWEFLGAKAQCVNILMDVMVEHDHVFKTAQSNNGNMEHADDAHKKIYTPDWNDQNKEGTAGWFFKKWMETSGEKDAQKLLDIQPKMGLMIATPSHDGNCAIGYALGLADMAIFFSQQNVYFEMARVVGSSLIPHARNSLVDMFLKSRCQKLLFVDSDQGFDRQAILHLFQSNKRIIAGITPHKRFPINFNFEPLPEDAHFFKDLANKSSEEFIKYAQSKADPKGEIEVNRAGTGFLMIDRSVFEFMKDHVEQYEPFDNKTDVFHKEYFKFGIDKVDGTNKRYLGEDWFFTQLAKKLKIPIFINANSIVTHHGHFTFDAGIRAG